MNEPIYANSGPRGFTMADIECAAAKWADLKPIESAITVSPDIEAAAKKLITQESGPMPGMRLDVYVDPSLRKATWHFGKPRWIR